MDGKQCPSKGFFAALVVDGAFDPGHDHLLCPSRRAQCCGAIHDQRTPSLSGCDGHFAVRFFFGATRSSRYLPDGSSTDSASKKRMRSVLLFGPWLPSAPDWREALSL
jgi:hypothetical protein